VVEVGVGEEGVARAPGEAAQTPAPTTPALSTLVLAWAAGR
jgi:hypothetical protein